jgi:hypothetical protein
MQATLKERNEQTMADYRRQRDVCRSKICFWLGFPLAFIGLLLCAWMGVQDDLSHFQIPAAQVGLVMFLLGACALASAYYFEWSAKQQ